jgi:hypothetical protein
MMLVLSTASPQCAQALAAMQPFVAVRTVLVLQLLLRSVTKSGEVCKVSSDTVQCL